MNKGEIIREIEEREAERATTTDPERKETLRVILSDLYRQRCAIGLAAQGFTRESFDR